MRPEGEATSARSRLHVDSGLTLSTDQLSSHVPSLGASGLRTSELAALGGFHTMLLSIVVPLLSLAKDGPCNGCTAVFYAGLNGSACYRIPSIIKTS